MTTNTYNDVCPVCGTPANMSSPGLGDKMQVECARCGKFLIGGTALTILRGALNPLGDDKKKAAVGYWLRTQQRFGKTPTLADYDISPLAADPYFPPVGEQLELLLEHIGNSAGSLGASTRLDEFGDQYRYGGASHSSLGALLNYLCSRELVEVKKNSSASNPRTYDVSLTVAGWLEYEEIKRGETNGRNAFMAMPFHKPDLEDQWLPSLREAVNQVGYKLIRVDDEPEPGLIDIKIREQIKAARFLIVELTHANNGAYWEGGFAEGLGKPVIYTCKKDAKAHFDVDHSFRISWDPSDMGPALESLKAAIRNTVPDALQEEFEER